MKSASGKMSFLLAKPKQHW